MFANAVLTELRAPGQLDRTGDVEDAGTVVWTGRIPAYLKRERRRAISGGGMTLVEGDSLFLLRPGRSLTAAVPGDQARGSVVTVEDRRTSSPTTRQFRVVEVQHSALGSPADSLRLELDDERTV